jgi:hypothetical protein
MSEVDLEERDLRVTLDRIEFPTGHEELDPDGRKRTVFVYRLHVAEGVSFFPVTMTEDHDDIDDLIRKADLQLFVYLRIFAERARRKSNAVELTFKSP